LQNTTQIKERETQKKPTHLSKVPKNTSQINKFTDGTSDVSGKWVEGTSDPTITN